MDPVPLKLTCFCKRNELMPSKWVSVNTPLSQTFIRLVSISDVKSFSCYFLSFVLSLQLVWTGAWKLIFSKKVQNDYIEQWVDEKSRTNWKQVCVGLTQQKCWVGMSVFILCPEQINSIRLLCGCVQRVWGNARDWRRECKLKSSCFIILYVASCFTSHIIYINSNRRYLYILQICICIEGTTC